MECSDARNGSHTGSSSNKNAEEAAVKTEYTAKDAVKRKRGVTPHPPY